MNKWLEFASQQQSSTIVNNDASFLLVFARNFRKMKERLSLVQR